MSRFGLPKRFRVGFEIAANEESERVALEGDLWLIEQEWQEAERIAAISDSLAFPRELQALLMQHEQARASRQ